MPTTVTHDKIGRTVVVIPDDTARRLHEFQRAPMSIRTVAPTTQTRRAAVARRPVTARTGNHSRSETTV